MKNLNSLLYDKIAGRAIYGGVSLYQKKKEPIKPIWSRGLEKYTFTVNYVDYFWGIGKRLELDYDVTNETFWIGTLTNNYCEPKEFEASIVDYFNKTCLCSLDYILDELSIGDSFEFVVEMSKDDFNNKILTESIVKSFVDKFLECNAADIAWHEYQEWLENEYRYV